jgi:hypothetical protein
MCWYVDEILIRQQLAEARRRADHNHLVREARSGRAPSDFWPRLGRLFRRPVRPAPIVRRLQAR